MSAKYFIMLPESAWAGPTAFKVAGPDTDLHRGERVDQPDEPFEFDLRVDDHADDPSEFPPLDLHDPGKGRLLLSPRFKACLADAGITNVQYFPAKVVYAVTGETYRYDVANIVGLVSALDVEASDCFVDEDGNVETFDSLRLDETKLAGHDLARLYEEFHLIVISENVKKAIEDAALTGVTILKDEDWEPGML